MSDYHIDPIRWPDEFRYVLNSIAQNMPKHASMEGSTMRLENLNDEQDLILSLFYVVSEAEEIIGNLNLAMSDLDRIGDEARIFGDRDPFRRYKFLMRMWLYEFARFEDLFGYYTLWHEKRNFLDKKERKELRDEFYKSYEPFIRIRNTMMHDSVTWEGHATTEITLLQAADHMGKQIVDRDGKSVTWNEQMSPLCKRILPLLYEAGRDMRITWNMLMAHLALRLVQEGKLKKSKKPYEPQAEFLRPGRPDR